MFFKLLVSIPDKISSILSDLDCFGSGGSMERVSSRLAVSADLILVDKKVFASLSITTDKLTEREIKVSARSTAFETSFLSA